MHRLEVRDELVRPQVDSRISEEMRCINCGRLLAKMTQDALRPQGAAEIKCRCGVMNYAFGKEPGSKGLATDPLAR